MSYLPFLINKSIKMACTSCKKKTVIIEEKNQIQSDFSLRNTGVHQISFGGDLLISNSNMSNELAIAFLKENPNRISLFENFPTNWKDLIDGVENVESKNKESKKGKSK